MACPDLERFCCAVERTRRPDGRASLLLAAYSVWGEDSADLYTCAFLTLQNALDKGFLRVVDPSGRNAELCYDEVTE